MTTSYLIQKPRHRSKVAIIDFDWTICKPKNNKTFPSDIDDWEWLRPSVPDVIKGLYKNGYAICIATNQSKDWKHTQIINALTTLNIPIKIVIATTKESYKPSLQIYETMFENKPIDKVKSFMCGDALGRATDHSDCDLKFAQAIAIKIISPEELFPFQKTENVEIKPTTTQEIVIMVGMPGSGKSHFAKTTFNTKNYVIIEGDIYKTSTKMIKVATPHLDNGLSVVFDATNPSHEKRNEYIQVAERYKIPVRCIYMNTPMEEAMARNNKREKPVPRIVYNVFNKKFEMPLENCSSIIITPVPHHP